MGTMAALCEEFGISRKTGYKIWQRYQHTGVRGLEPAPTSLVRPVSIVMPRARITNVEEERCCQQKPPPDVTLHWLSSRSSETRRSGKIVW